VDIKEPSIVDFNDTVSKAFSKIVKSGLSVIVTKEGKYYGLIDDRDIRQNAIDAGKTKCGTIAMRAPTLDTKSGVEDMCKAFFAGRFKSLAVLEKGKVAGAFTRSDLIHLILEARMLEKNRVENVMSAPAVCIDSKATIANAKALMKKHNVRRLIVTENSRLAGIISTFDMVQPKLAPKQSPLGANKANVDLQQVGSHMREETVTIEPEKPTSDAAKLMVQHNVSAVIVSDGLTPLGILTARDLFETVMKTEEKDVIYISGLDQQDRESYDAIHDEAKKILGKMQKSLQTQSLSIHVKREGRRYSIRARLQTAHAGIISASAQEWDIFSAMKAVLNEIKRMAARKKPSPLHHS